MSGLEAARMGDQIGHTSAWAGLIAGALIGLAIGAAIVFTVVTGGAGAVLIAAAVAGAIALGAGGALAGMEIGKMYPGDPCGTIKTGSPDTTIEKMKAARADLDVIDHGNKLVAQGSASVFVNGKHLGRISEKAQCGGIIKKTCTYTFIGGETVTTCKVDDEVPSWLVTTLKWTALIAGGVALVLTGIGAGVTVALLGLGGSLAGGYLGSKLGGLIGGIWGERAARVGEILGNFGGSLLGGMGAVKLGEAFGIVGAPEEALPPGAKETPSPEEVANAKEWSQEKLANTEPTNSHPEYTPEQIRAAQAELKAVNAENYQRVMNGELEHPNATPEQLRMAVEGDENGRVPLTYKDNPEVYRNLQGELQDAFQSEGITDATVVQIGSGTTGWKGNPVKYLQWQEGVADGSITEPWETYGAWKPSSDTDFAVFSDQAQVQAQGVDAPVNSEYGVFKNGARPGDDPAFPDGKPGIANSDLGGKLNDIATDYNQQVYDTPNPKGGGFDFKLNIGNDPFTTPPTVYQGPAAPGAPGAPAAPNTTGSAGTAAAGGTGVQSGLGDPNKKP